MSSSDSTSTYRPCTMTVFESLMNGPEAHTNLLCGNSDWDVSSVYRTVQAASIVMSSNPVTATTTPATPASSTTVPATTSTSAETPSSAPASSQAWIAGAVAGPIVGCALVGLLVWWIMRRRMKKVTAGAAAPAPAPSAPVTEAARHTSSTYGQYQPGSHWPNSSPPPPSHGPSPSYGWENRQKSSPPPVSNGTPAPLHELSHVPGNVDHAGVVYELHHGN
ncbi:hypothetical protein PG988_005677 [Apiospora saccharicola]